MYRYDEFDREFVTSRVAQFGDQVERRLAGEITEEQFKPLRLMNGVYLQLHAYMLRVAIPYGTLSSRQLRMLAHIARIYDKGYGHFTTRQNIQFHWPALAEIPDALADLASVEMHALQTSGNCIRNISADHFAGAAADEVADPRPYAEILRQWSSAHPEFAGIGNGGRFGAISLSRKAICSCRSAALATACGQRSKRVAISSPLRRCWPAQAGSQPSTSSRLERARTAANAVANGRRGGAW